MRDPTSDGFGLRDACPFHSTAVPAPRHQSAGEQDQPEHGGRADPEIAPVEADRSRRVGGGNNLLRLRSRAARRVPSIELLASSEESCELLRWEPVGTGLVQALELLRGEASDRIAV